MPKKAISTRLQVGAVAERLAQRRLADLAFLLQLGEGRAFGQLGAHPHRDRQQQHRDQERNPPAPFGERLLAHPVRVARITSNAASRPNEADDWIQPVAAPRLSLGGMFGDIDGGAAIFAAQRDALEDAKEDEQRSGRRCPAVA